MGMSMFKPAQPTCLLTYPQSSGVGLGEQFHNAFSDVQKMLSENSIGFQPQRKRKYEPCTHKKIKSV